MKKTRIAYTLLILNYKTLIINEMADDFLQLNRASFSVGDLRHGPIGRAKVNADDAAGRVG
jgi:hypothetical protein